MCTVLESEVTRENYRLFTRCLGNSSPEGADFILLTEQHNSELCRKINARVIESLYRPGDLVLVESVPFGESVSSHNEAMTKKINIPVAAKGWDHPDINRICREIISLRQRKFSTNTPCLPSNSVLHALTLKQRIRELLMKSFQTRNSYLERALEENKKEGRRVFLIAGRAHLLWEKQNPYFDHPAYSTESLNQLLKRHRFVVFDSKQFEFSINDLPHGWRCSHFTPTRIKFLDRVAAAAAAVDVVFGEKPLCNRRPAIIRTFRSEEGAGRSRVESKTSPGGDPGDPGGSSTITIFDDQPKKLILRLRNLDAPQIEKEIPTELENPSDALIRAHSRLAKATSDKERLNSERVIAFLERRIGRNKHETIVTAHSQQPPL